MELESFGDNMAMEFEVVAYVRTIINNKDSLCIVCQVEDPDDECWDRYQLKCCHISHTRCIRRWCGRKDTSNCPLCGEIEEIKGNRCCDDCKVWGHSVFEDDYRQYCMKQKSAIRIKTKRRKS